MGSDDRGRSLADEAASWVPPWLRVAPAGGARPEATANGAERTREALPATDRAEEGGEDLAAAEAEDAAAIAGDDALAAAGGADDALAAAGGADDALAAAGGAEDGGEVLAAAEADDAVTLVGDDAVAADQAYTDAPGDEAAEALAGAAAEPLGDAAAEPPGDEAAESPVDEAEIRAEEPDLPLAGTAPGQVESPRPDEEASSGPLALVADAELRGALEAILLVVEEPVSEATLAQVLQQPTERVAELLSGLAAEYESTGRGFELRKAAGGWRLYTRPQYAQYVERFVLDGQQVRLTQAALETLAVIAYKQPVTRSRISAIRGVNCDGVIRTLVSRGLVEECGTEPDSGAFLYRTTTLFLEKLGLNSVEELPPLAPFLPDDVDEISDAPR
ncbi:MAG: SMC-Scp complex subunit ScpB [Micromonosporaceae bacterium]|nr:SMC-Scp complex subunit ScpB [Micromonosporaceae bacterium]